MECPFCGAGGITEDAVFCPHCRYQFRPENEPEASGAPYRGRPENGGTYPPADPGPGEIRIVEALLIQPAVLLMIFFSAGLWMVSGEIAGLSVSVSGVPVRYGAVVCMAAGAVAAWIVYRLMLVRLR